MSFFFLLLKHESPIPRGYILHISKAENKRNRDGIEICMIQRQEVLNGHEHYNDKLNHTDAN